MLHEIDSGSIPYNIVAGPIMTVHSMSLATKLHRVWEPLEKQDSGHFLPFPIAFPVLPPHQTNFVLTQDVCTVNTLAQCVL